MEALDYTGWRTKCHTTDCAHNTFLLLQKHLTSGTELILIDWKIVPNEEHVQRDHRFASTSCKRTLAFVTTFRHKSSESVRHNFTMCALSCATFSGLQRRSFLSRPENVAQLRAHIVKLCRALSEDLCRKVVTNARVRLQEVVRQNGGHIEHVLH